jgi:hypothetical protein
MVVAKRQLSNFSAISWPGQTKDYNIGICCISYKGKDWLAWNQDNVSEWGDMSIRGLLFQ